MDDGMYKYILFGFIIGIAFFIIFENSNPSNSFMTGCWIRKQPDWLVPIKCYIIGTILIYRGFVKCNDKLIIAVGSAWIGLHLAQDIGERYYLFKMNKTRETG